MFIELIRDVYLELRGVDSKAAEAERKAEREAKRKKRVFLPVDVKVIAWILGVLYLLITGFSIASAAQKDTLGIIQTIRFIFLSICDIAALVCLAIGTKKSEIVALILIVVFVLSQYFTAVFL